MWNRILFVVLLGLSLSLSAQKKGGVILWAEDRPLSAKDFKAKPNKASSYAALTASGISCNISYEENILKIETATAFKPKESWMKDKEDPQLLAHEQFHFNITELFAREFRKKILNKEFRTEGKKLFKEVIAIYNATIKEMNKYQKRYDQETNHSINKEAQLTWEAQITERINGLKEYSEPSLTIEL